MKRTVKTIVSVLAVTAVITGASAQNAAAFGEYNGDAYEQWKNGIDYEKMYEDMEEERIEEEREAQREAVRKNLERDQREQLEREKEQNKKEEAYSGAYVDFDDNERYLPKWYDDGNKDIFTHDRLTISGNYLIIKPETKIGNKLKNELKSCKKASHVFKYTISNKKNTIKMTHSSFKSLVAYIKDKFQSSCDEVIGIEQNGIIKNIEFDTADYSLNIYVTGDIDSEYSYGMTTLKEKYLNDVLYYAKMYGLFFGAEDPDEIQIVVLDVYTDEVIFNN